jgi:hypothetical protein
MKTTTTTTTLDYHRPTMRVRRRLVYGDPGYISLRDLLVTAAWGIVIAVLFIIAVVGFSYLATVGGSSSAISY